MSRATKTKLKAVEKAILQLQETERAASIEKARLLYEARENHFEDTISWIQWARDMFNIERRSCFTYRTVTLFLRAAREECTTGALSKPKGGGKCGGAALLEVINALSVRKLDIIAAIPIADLAQFMDEHDPHTLERDYLRDAVAGFLGRVRTRQLDFWGYSDKWQPDRLLVGLDNPEYVSGLDPKIEARFMNSHLQRLRAAAGNIREDDMPKLLEWRKLITAQINETVDAAKAAVVTRALDKPKKK